MHAKIKPKSSPMKLVKAADAVCYWKRVEDRCFSPGTEEMRCSCYSKRSISGETAEWDLLKVNYFTFFSLLKMSRLLPSLNIFVSSSSRLLV